MLALEISVHAPASPEKEERNILKCPDDDLGQPPISFQFGLLVRRHVTFLLLDSFFTTEFYLGVIDPAAMAQCYTEDLSLRQYRRRIFDWCPKSILVRSDEMNEKHRVCRVCTSS